MGIEPTTSAWKAEVLPLNHIRKYRQSEINKQWSGRRDSNSRPSPWQGDALPLSHSRIRCSRGDLNPYPRGMEPKGDVTLVKDFYDLI